MATTSVTSGFWRDRLDLNRSVSMPAVLKTFEDTGRVRALTGDLRPGEAPHMFWESDLAKWIEAAFIEVRQQPDAQLLQTAEEIFDKIIANQESDGYLNSYFSAGELENRFTNLRVRHELYCAGHLLEAALAHAQLKGESRFLEAMERYMDFIAAEFGPEPEKRQGYPGHQEIELALTKAYEQTGKAKFLELAHYFIDERGRDPKYFALEDDRLEEQIAGLNVDDRRGRYAEHAAAHSDSHGDRRARWNRDHSYAQAHARPVDQATAEGHSVRALYMYSAMADLARLRDDPEMLAACRTLWRNIVDRRMYVHGGLGSAHIGERFSFDYDLPNDMAYAETCASIALMFFAERLSRIERRSEYADIIERALYNTVLASTSRDGQAFFYDNYLECQPEFLRFQRRRRGVRDEYHSCSCCPPNVLRILADLGRYIFAEVPAGLEVHQFISGSRQLVRDGESITVTQTSDFPWKGKSRLDVHVSAGQRFTIFVRVPDWDPAMSIRVNGERYDYSLDGGYAVIDRDWQDGDRVDLAFDFTPRVVRSNPMVRYDVRRAAVFRGPLLYCLEAQDNFDNLNSIVLPDSATFEEQSDDTLAPGCIVLSAEAVALTSEDAALYTTARPTQKPVTVRFIPYFLWANRGENEMLVWVNQA